MPSVPCSRRSAWMASRGVHPWTTPDLAIVLSIPARMSLPSAIIVRRAAFARTEQVAYQQIPPLYVQITDITADARTTWRKTWEGRHPSGYGEFPWERLWFRHCRYSAEAFQMAIWSHETLCGLAIGTIPKARRRLTLRYMEAKPNDPNPLRGKIMGLVAIAAEYYTAGLDLPLLELQDPAPGLVTRYQAHGFTLAHSQGHTRYLVKRL